MTTFYSLYIEDYIQKAQTIFSLLNQFRKNPKSLAKRLELIRTYLDPETNVLSEPNKIQIQMVEGDSVFKEAITFLNSLSPLMPLEWDENLAQSALEHVTDIGPKGLLLYQSSDGTEPEERISKYGNYSESLGENIDFGPNDAIGVIISLTLDDGEEQRPHRENLFKSDFKKVGIACGPHKSEFQMCVMDFAYDFFPLNNNVNNLSQKNKMMKNQQNQLNMDLQPNLYNNNLDLLNNRMNQNNNNSNQSPLVKLSLERTNEFPKGFQNKLGRDDNNIGFRNNIGSGNNVRGNEDNEIEELTNRTKNIMNGMRVKEKKVEIITKIIYTYEDGSTKEVVQTQKHSFK